MGFNDKFLLLLAMASGFAGCQKEAVSSSVKSTDGKKKACFGIVNGNEVMDYPEVGLILTAGPQGLGACTGTWVSDTTMLTASHCVTDTPTGGVTYIPGDSVDSPRSPAEQAALLKGGVRSLKALLGTPALAAGGSRAATIRLDEAHGDMAAVLFPAGTAPASTAVRNGDSVSLGAGVIAIGYGATAVAEDAAGEATAFTKRGGRNKTYRIAAKYRPKGVEDVHFLVGRATTDTDSDHKPDTVGGHGDSGSPLLFDGLVVGIASMSMLAEGDMQKVFGGAEALTGYADTASAFAQEFFERAVAAGMTIDRASKARPAPDLGDGCGE